MDFEKKLGRLEEIVGKMEGGHLALEDSLKFFEEGVRLARECTTQLDQAEQKVKILMSLDSSGQPVEKDFAVSDESDS